MYYFQYLQFYACYHSENCIKIRWHQELYDFTIYADQKWLYLVQIPKQKQKKSKSRLELTKHNNIEQKNLFYRNQRDSKTLLVIK